MSVVSLVIHDDYALIMGDTKLSGNPDRNTCSKVFKKYNILIGFTGNLMDVGIYLHPILTPDYTINEEYAWKSPIDFFSFLDTKFYDAITNNINYDARIVVAAKFGEKYVAKYYCTSRLDRILGEMIHIYRLMVLVFGI